MAVNLASRLKSQHLARTAIGIWCLDFGILNSDLPIDLLI